MTDATPLTSPGPSEQTGALQEAAPPQPWAEGSVDGDAAPKVDWGDEPKGEPEPVEQAAAVEVTSPVSTGVAAEVAAEVETPKGPELAEGPEVEPPKGPEVTEVAVSVEAPKGESPAPAPEELATPRRGSMRSAMAEEVPFTSAVPPSELTSPQESPNLGQGKDEPPGTFEEVTIDMDGPGVGPVPTTKGGDANRSSEKKSQSKRGSLGSYKAETLLYDRLEIEATATEAEIRNAYKKMALQLHPDKGGDPEKFKQMKEAYEILSTPQKRTVYDLHGMEGIKRMEQAAQMQSHMSDVTPMLLVMMELAQSSCCVRSILVTLFLLLGWALVCPLILVTVKWDGETSFGWAAAFIPFWIFQVVILCCQNVFLSMHQPPRPDEEDPETAENYAKVKKELCVLRMQSCFTHVLLLIFQILLILRLEGTMTASWVVVIAPWLALEVWWFLFRVYLSPVAWALSDPQAATEAATQGKRPLSYWLFLIRYLQVGVFRFITAILIAARANAAGQAVSWWLVFLPLYLSLILFVAIPCLERVVKRRRQGSLLGQEEDTPGPVAAKGCTAIVWLIMIFVAAGKLEGGIYSAAWVFSPIFFLISLAVCVLSVVIVVARPQHFQRAAESMGEPIGKPAETE